MDKVLCLVSKGNPSIASCHFEVWNLDAEADTQYASIISSECELCMTLIEMLKRHDGAWRRDGSLWLVGCLGFGMLT